MSLWKRGTVYWSYVYIKGIRHHKSTGTGNRRQAELCELEFKKELQEKLLRPRQLNPEMTFGELAARFIANAKVRPHHLDRLKILLPYFSDTAIGQIDKGSVRKYRQARHDQKTVSDTTVNRDIEVLRHILYWAVDEEHLLLANPLARVRLERERRKRRPVLSVEEEIKLLTSASEHLKLIITAALDTGMRRGELLNQLWQDVDFSRLLISVTKSKTAEGEAREIPLTARMVCLLSDIRQESGLIFTFKDKPIHRIKTAWKTAVSKSGIRPLRFHDLRHTFNTRLMEAGVMQEIRKALMGHSSGEDINSIYTHVELPAKRRAMQMLETWCAQQIELQKGGKPKNEPEPKTVPAGDIGVLPAGTGSHQASD